MKSKIKAKRTFPEVKDKVFRRALEKAGGYPQLGKALGITRQSIHKWDAIPDRWAVAVETELGIPRQEVAPHLFK